jgi:hypothetical protein
MDTWSSVRNNRPNHEISSRPLYSPDSFYSNTEAYYSEDLLDVKTIYCTSFGLAIIVFCRILRRRCIILLCSHAGMLLFKRCGIYGVLFVMVGLWMRLVLLKTWAKPLLASLTLKRVISLWLTTFYSDKPSYQKLIGMWNKFMF